jgi:hypothetical protein
MLHFFKFRQDLLGPVPAKDAYIKRKSGHGWPEQCPPIRGANSFGYDILANHDVTFLKKRDGTWKVQDDLVIESDFNWSGDDESEGHPLQQQYAWFWNREQQLPHKISPHVFEAVKNQVKVSSFLYLKTDPNELLMICEMPNLIRPFRAIAAVVDTDWYPASYPYHVVLELDPREKRIEIKQGDPLVRIIPVRRDNYFAKQMTPDEFFTFFNRGQDWLESHGRMHEAAEGAHHLDITHTYSKQQLKSRFMVME